MIGAHPMIHTLRHTMGWRIDGKFSYHHEHTTDAPVGVDGPLAWRILNADVQHTETTHVTEKKF